MPADSNKCIIAKDRHGISAVLVHHLRMAHVLASFLP